MMVKRWIGIAAMLIATVGFAVEVNASVLASFDRVKLEDLEYSGFRLAGSQTLSIKDTGFGYRSTGTTLTLSNAWILNADSREVVWDMADAREEWKKKRLTTATYQVELPAGEYEVYYSTYPYYKTRKWRIDGFDWKGGLFRSGTRGVYDKLIDAEDVDDVEDLYERFSFQIEGSGSVLSGADVDKIHRKIADNAVVSAVRLGDHEYTETGFELKRTMKISIYAIGESRKDGEYDYGWIMNVDTHKKVWEFSYRNSDPAGGASKNRVIDAEFEAPAGRYVLVSSTDGSHSWKSWNQAPPYDPAFWGIVVRVKDPAMATHVKRFDYEDEAWKNVVVDITRVGEQERVKRGFTLKRDMDLRIYAIGEGSGNEMADFGWIVDATTHKRVWTMSYDDTDHAGGGSKNRVFDGVVSFKKGNYLAYFVSDSGHSYPEWNTAPPADRRRYGLTIVALSDADAKKVAKYKPGNDPDAIVQIVEVGNGEYISKEFELKKDTQVYVYAIGEGLDGRMYDYGWIEDSSTGRVVWEMSYRRTEHAGGASKNRVFSDTISLKAGKYSLFYESDASHSFAGFNAAQPFEPESWGIRLIASK